MKRRKYVRALGARTHTITLAFDGEALPTEFRLFQSGWNNTENGKYLFDPTAAASVMKAYQAWGVDLAIDLEHQMLNVEDGAPDPTARDARGWCKLELRGGELWAVDVKWTPDGAARLTNKTQRYVSPAFEADPKTKRVSKMLNIAITAMPATHNTPALVAASARGKDMDYGSVKKALDALGEGDHEAAAEILKHMIASAAGDGAPSDADGSEGDGAEGVPGEPKKDSAIDPKVVDESVPAAPQEESDEDEKDEENPKKKTERKAMRAMLRRITGTNSFAAALDAVEKFRASHVALEKERVQLAKEREVLEGAERRELVGKLVKCGAEFPATVFADDKASALKPRWAKMAMADLRTHVSEQLAARAGKKSEAPRPPAGSQIDGVKTGSKSEDDFTKQCVEYLAKETGMSAASILALGLDPADIQVCAKTDCHPQVYAQLKAKRDVSKG